jgi:hypothetical protein
MKLCFLKEDNLNSLKDNVKFNVKKYSSPTNEWVTDFFDGQSPFAEYKIEVNDFNLDMSSDKPEETDVENIKRIYSNMRSLADTQATDERLWTGLEHGIFWGYMQYRWSMNNKIPTDADIYSRFFFSKSKRRSLITNTLSKLWWVGRLTYDENRKNPFELTEYLRHDFATRTLILFSSNYSSNPIIVRALLSSLLEFEKQGIIINRETFNEVIKYLNVLGGTYILDYFTEQEISDKVTKKLEQIII